MLAVIVDYGILAIVCLVGALIGHKLHEATHALAAVALGSPDVQVDWWHARVYFAIPDDWSPWRHRAVLLAPVTTGLLAGAVIAYYVVFIAIPWNVWGVGGFFGWFWYTFHGARTDFNRSRSLAAARTAAVGD